MSIKLRQGIHPLSYLGVDPIRPVNMWQFPRNPLPTDWAQYQLMDHWENINNSPSNADYKSIWILVQKSNFSGIWVKIISGGSGPITALQPAINGVPNGAPVTAINSIIQINNTDINIVPVAGVPNPNNLNLNLSPTVFLTNGLAAGLTAPGNITSPSVVGNGFVNVYSNATGVVQVINNAAGGTVNNTGLIQIIKRHGTLAAPTAINMGDVIGIFSFYGFDGTNYVQAASISSTSFGAIAPNQVGGNLVLSTHATTATGLVATPRVIITPTGRTQVGVNLEAGETVALEAVTGDITIDAGNLNLPVTTVNGTQGVLFQSTNPTLHSYTNGGTGDIYVGAFAGSLLTTNTSSQNSGFGVNSLMSVTSGSDNVAVGTGALKLLTTSPSNTACGWGSLTNLTTGNGLNTAVGNSAGEFLVSGTQNTFVGYNAGENYTTSESSNICIDNPGTTGESNVIRIGVQGSSVGQQNLCYIAGIFPTTIGGSGIAVYVDNTGKLGTVVSSIKYKENVRDMSSDSSKIMDLRPVTFNYKNRTGKAFGLIAEEVNEIFPELVSRDKDGEIISVKYNDLIPMLLNEIQKLNKRIERLEHVN